MAAAAHSALDKALNSSLNAVPPVPRLPLCSASAWINERLSPQKQDAIECHVAAFSLRLGFRNLPEVAVYQYQRNAIPPYPWSVLMPVCGIDRPTISWGRVPSSSASQDSTSKVNRVQRRDEPVVEPRVPVAAIRINPVLHALTDTVFDHEVTKDTAFDLALRCGHEEAQTRHLRGGNASPADGFSHTRHGPGHLIVAGRILGARRQFSRTFSLPRRRAVSPHLEA